jgi:hypothetical protein
MIALAESGHHDPVNIGNPDEFTLLELVETIKELTGSSSEIVHEALPTDDPKQRQPDITLARELLAHTRWHSADWGRPLAAVSPYPTPQVQDSRPVSRAPSVAAEPSCKTVVQHSRLLRTDGERQLRSTPCSASHWT